MLFNASTADLRNVSIRQYHVETKSYFEVIAEQ